MKRLLNAAVPALLVSMSALLLWGSLTNGHDWGDDFAGYVMQAKSIAEARPAAYVEASRFIIEQSSYPVGPITYPWGFPLLLAPSYALFGLNPIALKATGAVCYLLFLVLLWRGFRRHHSRLGLFVLVGLFAVNPTLLRFMDGILSDIPFLLASTLSVVLIGRVIIDQRPVIAPVYDQLLLGAAIAAAFMIRTNGVLLLATLGTTQLIRVIRTVYRPDGPPGRRSAHLMRYLSPPQAAARQLALHLLPYVSFAALVLIARAIMPDAALSPQREVLGTVTLDIFKRNLHYYLDLPTEFFDGVPHASLIYGASIPLVIAGAIARYRTDHHAIVYVALTFLLYIIWPPTAGLRFLLPVLPFYVSFALSKLEGGVRGSAEPARVLKQALCVLPVVFVLVYFVKQSAVYALANIDRHRAPAAGPFGEASQGMFSYIRENTKPESTVVFFKPRAMMLLTGRRSIKTSDVRELSRGDYLTLYKPGEMLDQVWPDEVGCMTENGFIQSVYANEDYVVFRLTPSRKDALRAGEECASLHVRQ